MGEAALSIRTMRAPDVERMMAWAAAEGWNPGADDAACFVGTDPEGFLVGYRDGAPAGCISVVPQSQRRHGGCVAVAAPAEPRLIALAATRRL